MEEVVQAAIDNAEDKPVVLVDSSDSPGAGSAGDSATVLEYLLPHRDTLRAAVAVSDTAAVEKAFAVCLEDLREEKEKGRLCLHPDGDETL